MFKSLHSICRSVKYSRFSLMNNSIRNIVTRQNYLHIEHNNEVNSEYIMNIKSQSDTIKNENIPRLKYLEVIARITDGVNVKSDFLDRYKLQPFNPWNVKVHLDQMDSVEGDKIVDNLNQFVEKNLASNEFDDYNGIVRDNLNSLVQSIMTEYQLAEVKQPEKVINQLKKLLKFMTQVQAKSNFIDIKFLQENFNVLFSFINNVYDQELPIELVKDNEDFLFDIVTSSITEYFDETKKKIISHPNLNANLLSYMHKSINSQINFSGDQTIDLALMYLNISYLLNKKEKIDYIHKAISIINQNNGVIPEFYLVCANFLLSETETNVSKVYSILAESEKLIKSTTELKSEEKYHEYYEYYKFKTLKKLGDLYLLLCEEGSYLHKAMSMYDSALLSPATNLKTGKFKNNFSLVKDIFEIYKDSARIYTNNKFHRLAYENNKNALNVFNQYFTVNTKTNREIHDSIVASLLDLLPYSSNFNTNLSYLKNNNETFNFEFAKHNLYLLNFAVENKNYQAAQSIIDLVDANILKVKFAYKKQWLESYHNTAAIFYKNIWEPVQAIANLNKVLDFHFRENSHDKEKIFSLYLNLGYLQLLNKNIDGAILNFEKSMKIDFEDNVTHTSTSICINLWLSHLYKLRDSQSQYESSLNYARELCNKSAMHKNILRYINELQGK